MGKLFWGIVIFLLIGAYMIKINSNLDSSDKDDQISFAKKYLGWIFQLGKNTAEVAGHVTKLDWLPNTSTNSTVYVIED